MRALFGDPLLLRASPAGLRRTPRADAMREPLRAALADLALIVSAGPPALADLRGAVRIVASDVPAAALGAALTVELAKRAPGIDLIFHPWHAGDEIGRLERDEVDLVVTVASTSAASLLTEPLGTYPYAVLMRRDHPAAAAGTFDLDCWLAFPHIVVSGRGDRQGSVDAAASSDRTASTHSGGGTDLPARWSCSVGQTYWLRFQTASWRASPPCCSRPAPSRSRSSRFRFASPGIIAPTGVWR